MKHPDGSPSTLACSTLSFGGRLEHRLNAIKKAGFDAVEFWPRDLYEDPRGPDYAANLLRDSGLSVCVYQAFRDYEGSPTPQRDHALDVAKQMMDQMAWIGADVLALCPNMREDASSDRGRIVDDLGRLAEVARERNVRVAWEHVCWGRWTSDYRDIWSMVEEVDHDNLGIMLDSLHMFCPNLPLDGIDAIDPKKIFLVELCDVPGTKLPYLEVGRHYRLLPGEGVGPVDEFIRRVMATGYTGAYSLEIMNDRFFHDKSDIVAAQMAGSLRDSLQAARAK